MSDCVISTSESLPKEVTIKVPDGLPVNVDSEGGNFSFNGYRGNLVLALEGGEIKTLGCKGDVKLILRRRCLVDLRMSAIGDLNIDALGIGEVKAGTVGNLTFDTDGIDLVLDDVTGKINGTYGIDAAVYDLAKKFKKNIKGARFFVRRKNIST